MVEERAALLSNAKAAAMLADAARMGTREIGAMLVPNASTPDGNGCGADEADEGTREGAGIVGGSWGATDVLTVTADADADGKREGKREAAVGASGNVNGAMDTEVDAAELAAELNVERKEVVGAKLVAVLRVVLGTCADGGEVAETWGDEEIKSCGCGSTLARVS